MLSVKREWFTYPDISDVEGLEMFVGTLGIFSCGASCLLLNQKQMSRCLNSSNKGGIIYHLGHKFQTWGQVWPLGLFGGCVCLKNPRKFFKFSKHPRNHQKNKILQFPHVCRRSSTCTSKPCYTDCSADQCRKNSSFIAFRLLYDGSSDCGRFLRVRNGGHVAVSLHSA